MRDPQMRRTKSSPGQTGVPPELVMVVPTGATGDNGGALGKKMIWDGEEFVDDGTEIEVFTPENSEVQWVTYSVAAKRWIRMIASPIMVRFELTDDSPVEGEVLKSSAPAIHAVGATVTLTNPHDLDLTVGGTGWAIDYGDGDGLGIENFTCPPE